MREWMQKIDWNKIRIRSRKDWVIFWVFVVCICYAIGVHYARIPNKWLFDFSNPYMKDLNQPYTWGQLMVFFFLLAVVTEVVLFLCKKPVKAKILVLTGALLMPMVILAGYRTHTNLIVSSLWKEEPRGVSVSWRSADSGNKENQLQLTEEEREELLELCRNMTIVSDDEILETLRQWHQENDREQFACSSSIHLSFDEKYGHNYSLWLEVYGGKVFLRRGYNSSMKEELTFFEDNGIVEWIEEMTASGTP